MTVGAVAWLWEMLCLQAPSSPWHLAGMPLAVARLATHAWITGLAVHALAERQAERHAVAIRGPEAHPDLPVHVALGDAQAAEQQIRRAAEWDVALDGCVRRAQRVAEIAGVGV